MRTVIGVALASGLLLIPAAASAQERMEDLMLGGVAGAIVGGPIGAVAGGAIGYTSGPRIAHGLGLKHHRHFRHVRHVRHVRHLHQNYAAR